MISRNAGGHIRLPLISLLSICWCASTVNSRQMQAQRALELMTVSDHGFWPWLPTTPACCASILHPHNKLKDYKHGMHAAFSPMQVLARVQAFHAAWDTRLRLQKNDCCTHVDALIKYLVPEHLQSRLLLL